MNNKKKLISIIKGTCDEFHCIECPFWPSLKKYRCGGPDGFPDEMKKEAYDEYVKLYGEEELFEELL